VLSELSPARLQGALQRLLPSPPTSRYTVVTMTPKPPGPLLAAALKLHALWDAAVEACGGEARAAAAAAGVGLAAAAAAVACVAWRRRGVGGGAGSG
jgi:hypothetical protein